MTRRRNLKVSEDPLPPSWLTHDPEVHRVVVDVREAAAAGVRYLEVVYDSISNTIQIATVEKEEQS